MYDTETLRLGGKEKNTVSPGHRFMLSPCHPITMSPCQFRRNYERTHSIETASER